MRSRRHSPWTWCGALGLVVAAASCGLNGTLDENGGTTVTRPEPAPSSSTPDTDTGTRPEPTPSSSTPDTGGGTGAAEGRPCASSAATAGSGAPQAAWPSGVPPVELEIRDVTVGDGAEAAPGDTATVDFVLFACSSGQVVENTWDQGVPFEFELGDEVVPGFARGVVGMREGGRRQIVVPPALGYGDTGSGGIVPGETLVFVVDLRRVVA